MYGERLEVDRMELAFRCGVTALLQLLVCVPSNWIGINIGILLSYRDCEQRKRVRARTNRYLFIGYLSLFALAFAACLPKIAHFFLYNF